MTTLFARPGVSRRRPLRNTDASLVRLLETGMFTTVHDYANKSVKEVT
jgi:hypothetical protein